MPDAILGSYADFKLIKTRSVVQVIVEVPLERAHEVTDLLGLPLPGAEITVAIARINLKAMKAEIEPLRTSARSSQLAGILCNEGGFRRFLSERMARPIDTADDAAKVVRLACAVKSRADLDTDPHGAKLWRDLKADYELWLRAIETEAA